MLNQPRSFSGHQYIGELADTAKAAIRLQEPVTSGQWQKAWILDGAVDLRRYFPNVRDHRWLPVARSVPVERSGTSTERDAGSHSVDRIVRVIF